MAKPFFALAPLSNRLSIATKLDAMRIKRNIGWYVRAYRSSNTLTFDDFVKNAKAPVAHHINDHQYCNRTWCWARDLDDLEQEAENKLIDARQSTTSTVPITADVCAGGDITLCTVINYKDVINDTDDEESFCCENDDEYDEYDSEHEYDDHR